MLSRRELLQAASIQAGRSSNEPSGLKFSLSRRLVDVGEPLRVLLPNLPAQADLRVFPRYLERSGPIHARRAPGRLEWLDKLTGEPLSPGAEYTPREPGNYIVRLRLPGRTLYRYFAAVTPEHLVYRMLAYDVRQPPSGGPELRNGGVPIDWALYDPARLNFPALLEFQEVFDDCMLPFLASAGWIERHPSGSLAAYIDQAVARLRSAGLRIDRAVLDWTAVAAAVNLYRQRGFDVIDGIINEGENHRGAPWFPYWMSPQDFLSPSPRPTAALGMIMDFCAGFHFHGPPDFHMLASECDWAVASPHADLAAREHVLIARNSPPGPVFVPTLLRFEYEAFDKWPKREWPRDRQLAFVRDFLDDTAFEHARRYPIVFARAIDIADYLRAHPRPQPRRILSSITHDWPYDRVWSPEWMHASLDVHRSVLPFDDSLAAIRRRRPFIWAKPTSRELIYYEDHLHSCRFEYACPKPLLWYDYADHHRTGPLAGRAELDVPDPTIAMSTHLTPHRYELRYRISGGRPFQGYMLAVWDIPREFARAPFTTTAREFILVQNSDGDYRGLLLFDLPINSVSLNWHL